MSPKHKKYEESDTKAHHNYIAQNMIKRNLKSFQRIKRHINYKGTKIIDDNGFLVKNNANEKTEKTVELQL